MEHEVFLIFGSNIEPGKNVRLAVENLRRTVAIIETSSLWRTQAIGTTGPEFLNLAVHICSLLSAHDLKEKILCSIEEEMGRIRSANKFADRTIDIDIVLFDDLIMEPHLADYDYLVLPFAEILPNFRPSDNSPTLGELAERIRLSSKAVCLGKPDWC